MCYYARTDYDCGDWKWGNMKLQCTRQRRIGETCGAKLVHAESITRPQTICKVCEELSTKKRRLAKQNDNIERWAREPDKFGGSLEKAKREARELDDKIQELELRRPSVATTINTATMLSPSTTGYAPSRDNMLPPISSMTSNPGYEYASPQVNQSPDGMMYSMSRNTTMPSAPGSTGSARVNMSPSISSYSMSMANTAPPPDNTYGSSYPRSSMTYGMRRQ